MPARRSALDVASLLLLAAGAAWLVYRMVYFTGWMDDDAFISFRYARNAVQGHGFVYNVGERVEGYTNFLWTLLLAAAHRLGADIPRTAQILGGTLAVGTVFLLARLARPSPFWALPALILCCSESWAAWGVGGLENVLSAVLVLAAFSFYKRRLEASSSGGPWLLLVALALTLAAMNHITSLLFLAVIGVDAFRRRRAFGFGRELWIAGLVFLVLYGSYTVWRTLYYGDLLPNTFFAKSGVSAAMLERGARYSGSILASFPVPYLAVAILGVLAATGRTRNPIAAPVVLAIAAHSASIVWFGGEAFPAYRSVVVLLPLFALATQAVVDAMLPAARLDRLPATGRAAAALAVNVAVVAASSLPLAASERVRRLDDAIALDLTGRNHRAAQMLQELLPSDCLVADSAAGLIAYDTGFRWLDTLGLTDRHIAHTSVPDLGSGVAGHEKGDGAYVLSRRPDYVLFTMWNLRPGNKTDRELNQLPEFKATYRPVLLSFRFKNRVDPVEREHSLYLFVRQGAPVPSQRHQ